VVAVSAVITGVASATPVGFDRVTVIVSSGSNVVSPNTSRVMVFDVSPVTKLIVPVAFLAPEVPPILL
jgi:hypothetical protein